MALVTVQQFSKHHALGPQSLLAEGYQFCAGELIRLGGGLRGT
jgi:hypothetical protein